jgi:hypothetical protein
MTDASPLTDVSPLRRAPVALPPVHDMEAPSSTRKQPLARKAISSDEEQSARRRSPMAKAAPTLPNCSPVPSIQALSHMQVTPHCLSDKPRPPPSEMPKQTPVPSIRDASSRQSGGKFKPFPQIGPSREEDTKVVRMRPKMGSDTRRPTKADGHLKEVLSPTKQPGNKVISDEETSAQEHSPTAEAALTTPKQPPTFSIRAASSHPSRDESKPSIPMATSRHEHKDVISTKMTARFNARQPTKPSPATHPVALRPAKTSSVLL